MMYPGRAKPEPRNLLPLARIAGMLLVLYAAPSTAPSLVLGPSGAGNKLGRWTQLGCRLFALKGYGSCQSNA